MMFVDYILQWARGKGYAAVYGSPEQVNEMMTNVPFSDSNDGTAVIMHLVADSETYNGHDRAVVAVYFASLCPFDFNGESLLSEQERLKNIGKALLNEIRTGNALEYSDTRWQYGYDDYAENVCWVCLRVTLTALAADCVPLPGPPAPDIASVPQAAFEWLALQGLSPVLRQHCATSQAGGFPASISACWAVVSDSDLGTLPYTAQVGDDTAQGDVAGQEIDSALVAQLPALEGMEGKWLYIVDGGAQVYESGEVCASASLGSVWDSGSDCWEVDVPEPDFLNFYMPFGGTITLRRVGSPTVVELEYSTDGCRTWQIWEQVGTDRTVELPAEGRMWLRNTSDTSTGFSKGITDYYNFIIQYTTLCYGNIMSLLCKNPNNGALTNYCFNELFTSCYVVCPPKMPSKILPKYCYRYMFHRAYLQQSADVMAESGGERSMQLIYGRCSYFNRVVLRLTSIDNNIIKDWLYGVASAGDIYCEPDLTLPVGADGVPSGWTRHDLSELE